MTGHLARALLLWCAMVAAAIANSLLSDALLAGLAGEASMRAWKAVFAISVIAASSSWLMKKGASLPWKRAALTAGGLWLAMSLAFELVVLEAAFGVPREAMLEEYRLDRGRLWALVLLAELMGPYALGALVNSRRAGRDA